MSRWHYIIYSTYADWMGHARSDGRSDSAAVARREEGQSKPKPQDQEGTILIPPLLLLNWKLGSDRYISRPIQPSFNVLFWKGVKRSNAAIFFPGSGSRKVWSSWKQRFGFPFCLAVKGGGGGGTTDCLFGRRWRRIQRDEFVTIGFRKQYAVPGPSVDILTWCSKSSQL